MIWRIGNVLVPRLSAGVKQQGVSQQRVSAAKAAAALHSQLFSTTADAPAKIEESMDFPGGKVPFTTQVLSRALQPSPKSGYIAETAVHAAHNAWRANLQCSTYGLL